jgi:hypothetical protein
VVYNRKAKEAAARAREVAFDDLQKKKVNLAQLGSFIVRKIGETSLQ